MSALVVVKLRRPLDSGGDLDPRADCENGCARRRDGLRRLATHEAQILGHRVALCSACARAWPAMWAAALEPAR